MAARFDAADFLRRTSEIKQRSLFAAEKLGQNAAARMEAEAKRNAPWTDRTGLARQTITGFCKWQGGRLRIGISGNREYSTYLELGHEGQYAVLWPTVKANEQDVMAQMRKVVR